MQVERWNLADFFGMKLSGLVAVSYTHLDVYVILRKNNGTVEKYE